MAKYRKKPVIVEAEKLTRLNREMMMWWCGGDHAVEGRRCVGIIITTLEGTMLANFGDFIIKGVNGEFYPCKPDIFEKTFEAV